MEEKGVWRTVRGRRVFIPDGMTPAQVFQEIRDGVRQPNGTAKPADEIVHNIGTIDRDLYSCITDDITTDELVVTEKQIQHIFEHHPEDFSSPEEVKACIRAATSKPDYIIGSDRPHTAIVLKEIEHNGTKTRLILRLKTSGDHAGYKNSVITFQRVHEKEWRRLIKNKKVLYKRE